MNLYAKMLIVLLLSAKMFAQKDTGPTSDDVKIAKDLRDSYSKDDVAILKSVENVSFAINKEKNGVTVNNSISELLMNINHRADISKYEFYDSASKIETFNLKYRNDKMANYPVKDEFYKDKDLFYNDARVKHVSFDFPVQGYTYKYEMQKKYDDVKYFTSIYFNDEFPIVNKTINITVPDWLDIEFKEFNFEGKKIIKTQKKDLKSKATVYTFSLENVPAIYKEKDSPGKTYLYPHILIIAKSFKNNNKEVVLFNSTADLYKWYKSLVDSMKDDSLAFKSKVDELTTNAKTDEEKIKNIYYWVQDNIRYIAFEDGIAGFKPDESNNVFQKRYGDCKGMANLIKQMLKLAGFDARLTWVGTKHIAYDYSTPSLAVDNHMICTLFYKGKKYFLDGTEKFNSFGQYAERIQNKEVMIEDGDKFIIEKVPMCKPDFNKEIYTANLIIEDEKLKGSVSRKYEGEGAAQFLAIFNSFRKDKKEETLEYYLSKGDKNITVNNIKTSDLKNRDQNLTVDYNLSVSNKVTSFDNEIYIDLEFMNEYKNLEFSERKTDYEFDYKTYFVSNVVLTIPQGYKVTKLPQDLLIKENDFDVSVTYKIIGNTIEYKKTFVFKNAVIKSADMNKWNEFNKNLVNNYNQQITISK
ncbi:transglutaminase-like domain-containing protein [Flavobacterium terrae]|uniref:Transglutaminase-like superfamily protein n=1 Tax=Flavobacterium terrae TaxID=415425 RepID=A0A1M6DP69_9FLAO|nr:transglutaminase-like domain-containing protein [Flavobacterium terrae]SHI74980.1 Transglutaminase-like superfamily protein [Flavobacterium terrae]